MNIPKIVKELPPAPKGVRDWILKDVAKGRYMIYSHKENRAVCTYCGHIYSIIDAELIPLPARGEKVVCPHCKSEAEYKPKGVGRKSLTEMTRAMVLVARGKSIYVSITEVNISYEEELPEVYAWLQAVYKFNSKEQIYYKHSPDGYWCVDRWDKMKTIKIPGVGGMGYFQPRRLGVHVYPGNLGTVNRRTDLKYADLVGFFQSSESDADSLMGYINLSAKYKSVELLYKAGFKHLIGQRADGACTFNTIYWRGSNLRKIFGMSMDHIRIVREAGLYFRELRVYKDYLKAGNPVTPEEAVLLSNINGSYYDDRIIPIITKYVPLRKIASYMVAQNERAKRSNTIRDYADYIEECEKLRKDMQDKRVLLPKDFAKAHKEAGRELRYVEDKVNMEAFIKNQRKLTGMDSPYIRNGLLIRPAVDQEELREEGRTLHHCVGGYADGIIAGYRAVLFIRKADQPDMPYYTLELNKGRKVAQCRGAHNCNITEEVQSFIDLWMAEVINRKPKRKKEEVA